MEKWMSIIPDNKKIVLMNIPGSHDSTAYNIFCLGSCFAKTQDLDITSQLNIGVRMFDFRVTKVNWCLKEKNWINSVICCHGICDCYHYEDNKKINLTYEHVLKEIRDFLNENPSETVIIKTESGRGNKYLNIQHASEIFDSILGDISVEYNTGLTLGELRGKIVSIFHNYIEGGTDIINIHNKYNNGKNNFNEFKVDGNLKVTEIKDLLEEYNYTFDEAEKNIKLPLNYETSCTGEYYKIVPLPRYEANIVNKFLKEYDFKKGNYYGWIAIDFIDKLITRKIIETNFPENTIYDMDDNSL